MEHELHLGQCAVRWLEALTISSEATYSTTPWAKEFADIVTGVAIMYEDSVLDRVKALFTDGSFSSLEPVSISDLEVPHLPCKEADVSLRNVCLRSLSMNYF